ncbi:hypothetical protein Tco_1255771 [Tanacetum coccineum]
MGILYKSMEVSKQVGFKQLGPGVETRVHGVSNDDTAVAERQLEDKQPEEKTNTDCLVKKQEKEYQTRWKIKTSNVLDSCNQRSTQQCMKSESGLSKVFWAEDTTMSTYLVNSIEQEMLEPVKVKCVFLGYHERIVGNKLWRLDDVTSKVVLYKNMGFNESEEYKITFIGSGVGTGSVHVLQGVEFEEVQTEDLIYYHLLRDREQHSTHKLFSYKEDNNEAAFVVAKAKKIYAHESLTFNDTIACEVISNWKAELKEDMDIRPDVYVLCKDCRKSSDDSHDYYWEYAPAKENVLGMEIIRDQSSNTLRVSQSRFYNRKLVQTLLEGHSMLSLEGSLSRDCEVEKNGKWSCIYAVRSQEYQMVCTRLDITSEDVGMLYKFDHGLQIDVQDFFVDFDYAIGRSITIMGKINHKVRVDDTRMVRKLRIYDAAHEGFINN